MRQTTHRRGLTAKTYIRSDLFQIPIQSAKHLQIGIEKIADIQVIAFRAEREGIRQTAQRRARPYGHFARFGIERHQNQFAALGPEPIALFRRRSEQQRRGDPFAVGRNREASGPVPGVMTKITCGCGPVASITAMVSPLLSAPVVDTIANFPFGVMSTLYGLNAAGISKVLS